MKVLGVSHSPTVDLGRYAVDGQTITKYNYKFKMIQNGDGTVSVDGTGS